MSCYLNAKLSQFNLERKLEMDFGEILRNHRSSAVFLFLNNLRNLKPKLFPGATVYGFTCKIK